MKILTHSNCHFTKPHHYAIELGKQTGFICRNLYLMRNKLIISFCIAVLLASCEFSVSTNKEDKQASKEVSSKESSGPLTGATISNDIELDAEGVKVKEAYLMDDNRTILSKNEAKLGERIRCVVSLDTGWTKYDGKSFIGASEKIMTDDGRVILDEPDLFKDYSESGLSAEDTKLVSVVATITTKEPGVDNYKVQFKIWDKRGTGKVTGRFKFKVN